MFSLSGNGFASGAAGDGLSQLVQGELSQITDKNLRLIASSIVGAAAAKAVGGNAQVGAGAAHDGVKYNDYAHRTHREGEIVLTKDGFFMVINGVDTAIEPPPEGVYFWKQDENNPDYGWDYQKGNGITTQDTYYAGTVDSQVRLQAELRRDMVNIVNENNDLLLMMIAGREFGLRSSNAGKWNQGSFGKAEDSLEWHFKKHGQEVGAADASQYLRKAEEFARNLRGAQKFKVDGAVEGVTRYVKNGKYIDLAPDGTIISFGRR